MYSPDSSPEEPAVAQTAADSLEDMVFTLETKEGDLFGSPVAISNSCEERRVEDPIYDLPPEETPWCQSRGYSPDDDVIYDVPEP